MQTTRPELNINKAIGFPAMQLSKASSGAVPCVTAEAALRCGAHAYVTSVYYTLITPPLQITTS